MAKFKLAFGIHNHQPVGNFDAVFEEAHTHAYEPFLKLVEQFPEFSLSLHQSGILWKWQERFHPEFFELVGRMIDNKQIDLLTGGFYEPILCSIPERDAIGQISMLTDYLKDHFEVNPEGLWLTERIWEPHLPKLLNQSGINYLPVDDTHFIYAGLEKSQLTGPFITENEGYTVRLLPIDKKLRYLIPFGTVEEVIAELRTRAEQQPDGLAIYADDGEKFGVWPQTYKHCYQDGWLKAFFKALDENSDWLEIIPLSKAASEEPVGRIYLPTASYAEMLHWSLPPAAFLEYESFEKWLKENHLEDRFGRFTRGGHWRGFLAKYDESNFMHKKMQAVSDRLAEYEQFTKQPNEAITIARESLYAGQCNCPYWHGVFGGLYLPHIRQAIYSNLIEAEKQLRTFDKAGSINIEQRDYTCDGFDDIIVRTDPLTAVFQPRHGGRLLELSLNQQSFNLTDTLTRRREGYHLKLDQAVTSANSSKSASIHDHILTKEEGLDQFLIEDWYLKRCFIDHFFTDDVDVKRFSSGKFGEEGDFILEAYDIAVDTSKSSITLSREGNIWRNEQSHLIKITKKFNFDSNTARIEVEYLIELMSNDSISVNFGIENNFTFQAGHAEDRYLLIDNTRPKSAYLDSIESHPESHSVAMIDDYRQLAIAIVSDSATEVWRTPIFTVSLSESGFEKVYQGTTLINKYCLHLKHNSPTKINLSLSCGESDQVCKNLKTALTSMRR